MSGNSNISSTNTGTSRFATTHWSVVLTAGKPDSSHYREALETLCRTYWIPLYVYLRRRGHDIYQAEDNIQAFFACLLEKGGLRLADPKRGRFRSFLLVALKHFLANESARTQAQKRGGGRKILSLNIENAESQYIREPRDELSPEKLFERSWALAILDRTMVRLQAEAVSAKKEKHFDCLKIYLTAEKNAVPYCEVATRLNMTEGAVKVAVHRLRQRYRVLLRDEIAQTVTTEEQINEEIRDLFAALAY